jgi:hypothetical protein
MNWLTGGKQGEAKRLISKLADVTQRDHAAQVLIQESAIRRADRELHTLAKDAINKIG